MIEPREFTIALTRRGTFWVNTRQYRWSGCEAELLLATAEIAGLRRTIPPLFRKA